MNEVNAKLQVPAKFPCVMALLLTRKLGSDLHFHTIKSELLGSLHLMTYFILSGLSKLFKKYKLKAKMESVLKRKRGVEDIRCCSYNMFKTGIDCLAISLPIAF